MLNEVIGKDQFQFEPQNWEKHHFSVLEKLVGNASITRFVAEAAQIAGTKTAFLIAVVGNELLPLAVVGFSLVDSHRLALPSLDIISDCIDPYEHLDMAAMPKFAQELMVHERPGWRYAVNVPISCGLPANRRLFTALICFDPEPRPESRACLAKIQNIGSRLSELFTFLYQAKQQPTAPHPLPKFTAPLLLKDSARDGSVVLPNYVTAPEPPPSEPQPDHTVAKFLSETLIQRQRLGSRKTIRYLALRQWAKPIKTYQIGALRALKLAPPPETIDAIAAEMAAAIKAVHGVPVGTSVVPVPCGHSGPGCLSSKLARALALQLGLIFEDAFLCQEQKGSSHPKTNVRRPRMKLVKEVRAPIILVDDVATSGAHLEEAVRLLSTTAPVVWPIVWIAD